MDQINLSDELSKLRAREVDVSSNTLLKTDTLRIVLIALRAGAKLHRHHADGRLSLQVLEGKVDFSAQNEQYQLTAGMLIGLDAKVLHEVIAQTDAVLLLTIAWPYVDNSADQPDVTEHRKVGYV